MNIPSKSSLFSPAVREYRAPTPRLLGRQASSRSQGIPIKRSVSLPLDDALEDDLITACMEQDADNPDFVWLAGGYGDDGIFEEDTAVAILANYLRSKRLGRGFFRAQAPKGKSTKGGGKGKGKRKGRFRRHAPPKRWHNKKLMSPSRCAMCEQLGHCARDCKNEPDERGKRRLANISFLHAPLPPGSTEPHCVPGRGHFRT